MAANFSECDQGREVEAGGGLQGEAKNEQNETRDKLLLQVANTKTQQLNKMSG